MPEDRIEPPSDSDADDIVVIVRYHRDLSLKALTVRWPTGCVAVGDDAQRWKLHTERLVGLLTCDDDE